MGKRNRGQAKEKIQKKVESSQQEQQDYESQELLDGQVSDYQSINIKELLQQKISSINDATKPAFIALNSILQQQNKLFEQRDKQIARLYVQYRIKSQPFVQKTNQIIQGTCNDQKLIQNSTEISPEQIKKGLLGIKVSQYWYNVFINSEIGDIITEQDHQPIKKITNFTIKHDGAKNTLTITINISQNSLFTNKTLTVTFEEVNQQTITKKHDKVNYIKKEQKQSFFNLFEKSDSQDENYMFYSLFKDFYHKILPKSLQYYFGLQNNEHDPQGQGQQFYNASEQDQSQEQQIVRSKKPKKKENKQKVEKNEKANTKTQKPQCKQQ